MPQATLPSGVASFVQSQAFVSSWCSQYLLSWSDTGKTASESDALRLHVALVPSSGRQLQTRFARSKQAFPQALANVTVSMQASSGKSLTLRGVDTVVGSITR